MRQGGAGGEESESETRRMRHPTEVGPRPDVRGWEPRATTPMVTFARRGEFRSRDLWQSKCGWRMPSTSRDWRTSPSTGRHGKSQVPPGRQGSPVWHSPQHSSRVPVPAQSDPWIPWPREGRAPPSLPVMAARAGLPLLAEFREPHALLLREDRVHVGDVGVEGCLHVGTPFFSQGLHLMLLIRREVEVSQGILLALVSQLAGDGSSAPG